MLNCYTHMVLVRARTLNQRYSILVVGTYLGHNFSFFFFIFLFFRSFSRLVRVFLFFFFSSNKMNYIVEWMRARGGAYCIQFEYRTCLCLHEISFCVRLRTHQCQRKHTHTPHTGTLKHHWKTVLESSRVESRKVCAWRCCVCHTVVSFVFVGSFVRLDGCAAHTYSRTPQTCVLSTVVRAYAWMCVCIRMG